MSNSQKAFEEMAEVEKVEKPPLGLMPERFHKRYRMLDILAAMRRYVDAGKYVPDEWIGELVGLLRTQGESDGHN